MSVHLLGCTVIPFPPSHVPLTAWSPGGATMLGVSGFTSFTRTIQMSASLEGALSQQLENTVEV